MRKLAALAAAAFALAACQDSTPVAPPTGAPAAARAPAPGRVIPGQYLVVFNDDVRDVPGLARRLVAQHGGSMLFIYESALKGFAARIPDAAAQALARNPGVKYVEQDQAAQTGTFRHPVVVTDCANYSTQKNQKCPANFKNTGGPLSCPSSGCVSPARRSSTPPHSSRCCSGLRSPCWMNTARSVSASKCMRCRARSAPSGRFAMVSSTSPQRHPASASFPSTSTRRLASGWNVARYERLARGPSPDIGLAGQSRQSSVIG